LKTQATSLVIMTQKLGIRSLIKLGVRVITAAGDELTDTSDPMKKAMRQIAGAFAELEKARLVAKLRGARERKRAKAERATLDSCGKCESRKNIAELAPEAVEAARKPNTGRSLREIAAKLEAQRLQDVQGNALFRREADAWRRRLEKPRAHAPRRERPPPALARGCGMMGRGEKAAYALLSTNA
jgi:hypothetical protein